MRVILIDDEKVMHLIMSKMLAKIPDIEIVAAFQDTTSASLFLDENIVHMAFVDISMPNESGMLFAQKMVEKHPTLHIVFVTSHKDYAMEAFDIFALDYIVKPVSQERLEKSVKRAIALHRSSEDTQNDKKANTISIYSMGGLEIRHGKLGKVKWRSRKSAELFGYLLLHHGRMVSRARITSDVFDGMPQKNAEKYLNTIAYQLRKALEPQKLKFLIKSDKDGYSLDINNAYVDFIDFEERIKQFSVIDATNIELAIETEEIYGGHIFGEKAYIWALNDIERLSIMHAAFVKKVSRALLKNKEQYGTAVRLLNKLLAYNELDEETVGLLLEAYSAQKDKVSLNNLYNSYFKLLEKELGIGPSQELAVLYSRLLATVDN